MTDQEINVALAELRGWQYCPETGFTRFHGEPRPDHSIPDHLNGIEALGHIHEVETMLTDQQAYHYAGHLAHLNKCDGLRDKFNPLHATARQRAIAILRTVGKYRETAAQ